MTTALERIAFVDLTEQLNGIRGEVDAAMNAVFERGSFILGSEVELFEREFAAYCGAKYAIGVDSGTSALELMLRAMGVGPGDEVVTISNSFVASALAVVHAGGTPVLVDPDPRTRNMSADRVAQAITPRTRVLLPVHMYGSPTDMEPIRELAARHNLMIAEDACQAHGARYRGVRAGSLGTAAAFSFYPSKNLGAFGDGGMVVTSDEAVAERVRMLRNYGQLEKNVSATVGFNKRLDELQAAVLRVKLRYLDEWNAARTRIAAVYSDLIGTVPGVSLPAEPSDCESAWHLYVINVDRRDDVQDRLAKEGISTGVHYPVPIHRQPALAGLGYAAGSLPVSEHHAATNLSLPLYPELDLAAVVRVAEAVQSVHTSLNGE